MEKLRHNITLLILYFFTLFVLLYGGYVFQFELLSLFTVLLISFIVIVDILTIKNKIWTRNALWLVAYAFYLLWLLLGSNFQIAQSMQSVYRIFTEMFLISTGLTISRKITEYLDETHSVVQEITYAHLDSPSPLAEIRSKFDVEIGRSLRYERPLSFLIIDVVPALDSEFQGAHLSRLQREMMEGYFNSKLGHEVMKLTRNTDLVAATERVGVFYILCPETERRSVTYLADRINLMVEEHFEATMRWGVSAISKQIPTFTNLLQDAQMDLENRSVNPRVRYDLVDEQILPYLSDDNQDEGLSEFPINFEE